MRLVTSKEWHPYNMTSFFIVGLFVGFIFTGIPMIYINFIDNSAPFLLVVMSRMFLILFIIQILIVGVFIRAKRAIKYQKIQSIIMPFYTFKFSVDLFLLYIFVCYDSGILNRNYYLIGLAALVIGLIIMIVSVSLGFRKVQQGHLKKGGRGLFSFKDSLYVPPTLGIALLAGSIPNLIAGYAYEDMLSAVIALTCFVVIYFTLSYYIQQLILLAYCKNRFSTFNPKE